MRLHIILPLTLLILLTGCGAKNKKLIETESELVQNQGNAQICVYNDEYIDHGKKKNYEEASEKTNTSKNDIEAFKTYDEFIEKINDLLDVMETSDSNTFLGEATRYLWFTSPIYWDFTERTDQFGYLQLDIDGDGVDELLLGIDGSEDDSYYVDIDSMFTLKNGIVYTIFESDERDEYKIYTEGIIERSFSYPNSSYGVEYYKYTSGSLELIESAYHTNESDDDEWRYYYSDSTLQKRELTEKEYQEMCDVLKNRYCKQEMQLNLHLFKEE